MEIKREIGNIYYNSDIISISSEKKYQKSELKQILVEIIEISFKND